MKNKIYILGIESSCDETSVAIVTRDKNNQPQILSNIIKSQIEVHKLFGGVVPELAARAHSDVIDVIVMQAIKIAKINPELYQKDANKIVNVFFDTLCKAITKNERVELRGFGVFDVKKRDARIARNPKNGNVVAVPAKM